MKTPLIALLLATAVVIGYPLLNEGTSGECSALEKRITGLMLARQGNDATSVLVGSFVTSVSNGEVAKSLLKASYPDMPPVLTCGCFYWRLLFDPDQTESTLRELVAADTEPAPGQAKVARDAMGALSNPAAALQPKPEEAPAPAYKPAERRDLDRLIDNAR